MGAGQAVGGWRWCDVRWAGGEMLAGDGASGAWNVWGVVVRGLGAGQAVGMGMVRMGRSRVRCWAVVCAQLRCAAVACVLCAADACW